MMKTLKHEHILKYYGMFYSRVEQEIHVVMELVNGVTLSEYVVYSNTLSETTAAYFITQILLGLQYIHSNGVIHRDVKVSPTCSRSD